MIRKLALSFLLAAGLAGNSHAQTFDLPSATGSVPTQQVNNAGYGAWFTGEGAYEPSSMYETYSQPYTEPYSQPYVEPYANYSPRNWVEEAEKAGQAGAAAGGEAAGGGGGGSLAAQATNSSAPLSQIQFQNTFIPESYGGSGYANQFTLQPVIAIMNKPDTFLGELFPYHIVRPTLPLIGPSSDPDGPVPDQGGLGDTTYFDLWIHPIKGQKGNNFAIGPVIVLPTSTNPDGIHGDKQLGLHEWQLGPAFAYINTRLVKDLTMGFLFEAPFSTESDAYSITVQPVFTKLLKGEKWIGIGDLEWKFDDQNGNYNIPLSLQFGKIVMAGKQPFKIFLQPEYTPAGFTSQPTAKYGVKLSISLLMPGANFGYSKEKEEKKKCGRSCLGCRHCR